MFLRAVLVGITYFQIIWKMKEDKSLFDRRAKEILSQKWKCLFTVVLRKLLIALLHVFTLLSRMYDTVKTCTFFFFEIGVSFRIKRVLLFFFSWNRVHGYVINLARGWSLIPLCFHPSGDVLCCFTCHLSCVLYLFAVYFFPVSIVLLSYL